MRYLLAFLFFLPLEGGQLPPSLCFMVADLKFSQEHGVKICEIQDGIRSYFDSDSFLHGGHGTVIPNLLSHLSDTGFKIWTLPHLFTAWQARELLHDENNWVLKSSFREILRDPEFLKSNNRTAIFVTKFQIKDLKKFQTRHPEILVIDSPLYQCWQDKFKVSELLTLKPHYKLYKKQNHKLLARQIREELPCNRYVIKPRGGYCGKGVIILDADELDSTLDYILTRSPHLKNNPDDSYSYWFYDPHDSFIIEQFFASDPIQVPHLNNQTYQPTMRIAFLMSTMNNTVETHFLGNYWLTPAKSLEEDGSLNEKHKTALPIERCCLCEPEITKQVQQQLREALPLFYKKLCGILDESSESM